MKKLNTAISDIYERLMPADTIPKKYWSYILFFGCTMLYTCRTTVPLCVSRMAHDGDWNKSSTATVLGVFFWGYLITQLSAGKWSKIFGGDLIIFIGGVGWILITFFTPTLFFMFSDSQVCYWIIVASRIVMGCLQGLHMPSLTTFVNAKWSEEERSGIFSFIVAGNFAGTLLCGSLGSLLLEKYGWSTVFHVLGTISFIWLIIFRFIFVKDYQRRMSSIVQSFYIFKKQSSTNQHTKPSTSDQELDDHRLPSTSSYSHNDDHFPIKQLCLSPAFWSIMFGQFCEMNAFYILFSWMPTYFSENFVSAKGWIFNVIPWLLSIISSIVSGRLADYLLKKKFSLTFVRKFSETIALFGTGFCLIILNSFETFTSQLIIMSFAVACCGFHNSGIMINPTDIAPSHAGSVFALMNMAGAIPGFFGVKIVGKILSNNGGWEMIFKQTGFFCFAGLVVFLLFGTAKKVI
ncbi:hypothetical protein SNEBB_009304 [Seison nebaliae]|nr:hypothetical protein SNEBB_009304 [Seison nebaliae]